MTRNRYQLGAGALASALLLSSVAARATTTNYLDFEAGLGFSSNPGLNFDTQSSAFGRISLSGGHSWSTEHSSTSLSAYVENTTYLKDYGSKQIFSLGASTNQTVSSTVSVYGHLGFTGDFGGQLSNRLLTVPGQPYVPDPLNPLPPPSSNPDLTGLSGRQYRATGSVGASIRSGARGTISLTAGAQRSFFTGSQEDANYTSFSTSAGYSQQVSERTSAGASVFLTHQSFTHGDWANTVNPTLTLSSQLSESLNANAGVGVMAIEQSTDGHKGHSVSPSFSASLCSHGTLSSFCAHIARDAQSALSGGFSNGSGQVAISTTASADYYRKLSPEGTLQASISAVHYTNADSSEGEKFRTTFVSAVIGYDRQIRNRLYAGISGGARHLFQTGPDPDLDLNANVYLRYRLGDLL